MCVIPYNKIEFQVQELPLSNYSQSTSFKMDGREICKSFDLNFKTLFTGFWLDISIEINDVGVDNRINNQSEYYYNIVNGFYNNTFSFNYIQNIPNNTLYLIFESLEFQRKLENNLTFFSQFERYDEKSNSYFSLFTNMLAFYPGEAFFVDFAPNIYKNRIGDYELRLGQKLNKLPLTLAPNEIGFGIAPITPTFKLEDIEMYSGK